MLKILIQLCVLTVGLCYATSSCHDLQKSQLASLNDRITQMLSTLYTPPQPSTTPSETISNATPTNEYTVPSYEAAYYPYHPGYPVPAPQVIYVSPSHGTSHSFSYAPPPTPNVGLTPAIAPSPYHHLSHGQPLDPYRALPIAPKPPIPQYYEHYPYPPPPQYPAPSPAPAPYAPTPYPSPYPYSWEYSSPYPEYRIPPTYPPKPVYSTPAPAPLPVSYQSPPVYPSPYPYSYIPPPYYPNQPELPPPSYYA